MPRRWFLKALCATVPYLVAARHFFTGASIVEEELPVIQPAEQEVEESLSPVLQALRKYNDKRLAWKAENPDVDEYWFDGGPVTPEQRTWTASNQKIGSRVRYSSLNSDPGYIRFMESTYEQPRQPS